MKFILIFFLISFPLITSGHTDKMYTYESSKIYSKYIVSFNKFEYIKKVEISLKIADDLLSQKNYNEKIYIYFDHTDSIKYFLGYDNIVNGWSYYKRSKNDTVKGLKIIVRDKNFRISDLIKLVDYASSNKKHIQESQIPHILNKYHSVNGIYDTVNSITTKAIDRIFKSHENKLLHQVISKKRIRSINKYDTVNGINYYFQDNVFYFYPTKIKQHLNDTNNLEKADTSIVNSFLKVSNIHEIIRINDRSHFVFTNDSTFYYLKSPFHKIPAPLVIKLNCKRRWPIRELEYKYSGIKRIIIKHFSCTENQESIYIIDSNRVISNYNTLETQFIKSLLTPENQTKNEEGHQSRYWFITSLVLLLLLILTLIKKTANKVFRK